MTAHRPIREQEGSSDTPSTLFAPYIWWRWWASGGGLHGCSGAGPWALRLVDLDVCPGDLGPAGGAQGRALVGNNASIAFYSAHDIMKQCARTSTCIETVHGQAHDGAFDGHKNGNGQHKLSEKSEESGYYDVAHSCHPPAEDAGDAPVSPRVDLPQPPTADRKTWPSQPP